VSVEADRASYRVFTPVLSEICLLADFAMGKGDASSNLSTVIN